MAVAVDVRPNGGVAIQILFAGRIIEPGPLATADNKRLVVGCAPIAHLSEWVPEYALIARSELIRPWWRGHQASSPSSRFRSRSNFSMATTSSYAARRR